MQLQVRVHSLRLVDGQLSPSKYCDLVLEDESGLCGFAFALLDAKTAMSKSQVSDKNTDSWKKIRNHCKNIPFFRFYLL